MQIADVIRQAQGGAAIANLAKAYGVSPEQADAVIGAVLPKLSERIERNTLSRGGLADIINALGHGHHEAYVDDPRMIIDPAARADGDAILSHILGTKDKSRAVAARAASETGVPDGIIKAMLPVIAGMMMGGLSKQMSGGLGEILGRMGGGAPSGGGGGGMQMPRPAGRPMQRPMPQSQGPEGSATDVLFPQNGQQSGGVRSKPGGGLEMPDSLPDGGQMGGGGGGRDGAPLPMPGGRTPGIPGNSDNPYGDLAEILRRGLGLPGGSGGPVVIQLPGGMSFPFPGGGGQGQGGGMQMPRGGGGGGGLPMPGGGGGGGLPMPGGTGGGMPWPQGGGQGGGGQGGGLPMPGGNGRGIELPGGNVGGGMLWNIIRSILGSALGFQGGGLMSWLFRMVFMKYGWSILRTILGRGLFGR